MKTLSLDKFHVLLKSPKGFLLCLGVAVGAYMLLRESVGVETMFSFILFGGFIVMHVFMHGEHGHGNHGRDQETTDDTGYPGAGRERE